MGRKETKEKKFDLFCFGNKKLSALVDSRHLLITMCDNEQVQQRSRPFDKQSTAILIIRVNNFDNVLKVVEGTAPVLFIQNKSLHSARRILHTLE